MPTISRFLGIVVSMFWNDHQPPHFHARYGEYEITVDIESGVVEGKFPPRSLGTFSNGINYIVMSWDLHGSGAGEAKRFRRLRLWSKRGSSLCSSI